MFTLLAFVVIWSASLQAVKAQAFDQYSFHEEAFLEDFRFVCFLLGAAIAMLGNASDSVVFTGKILGL
jgi:hypothetical protein